MLLLAVYYRKLKEVLINRYSILIGMSLILVFFQIYSLKKNYGDYTISYIDSITYYNYLGAKADCLKKNLDYLPEKNERAKYLITLSQHEIRSVANKDLKVQLKDNKFNLFKAYLFCIYSNSSKGSYIVSSCINDKQTSYFDVFHFLFKAISKVQNIVFTSVGIILAFYCLLSKKRKDSFILILSTSILYLFFMSAISCFQCDRFHIVLYPLIILLFAHFYNKKPIND